MRKLLRGAALAVMGALLMACTGGTDMSPVDMTTATGPSPAAFVADDTVCFERTLRIVGSSRAGDPEVVHEVEAGLYRVASVLPEMTINGTTLPWRYSLYDLDSIVNPYGVAYLPVDHAAYRSVGCVTGEGVDFRAEDTGTIVPDPAG